MDVTKSLTTRQLAIQDAMSNIAVDQYHWCRNQNMYVTRENVLQQGLDNVVVVDVRDDDGKGGKITGSLHLPDSLFDEQSVQIILTQVQKVIQDQKNKPNNSVVNVIFHCMESARRGPRCARRFIEALTVLEMEQAKSIPRTRACVLQGGFDQWIRAFFNTRRELIEDYDDEYWGYEELQRRRERDYKPLQHSLYERPEDQLATPWSDAGPNAKTEETI